MLQHPRLGGGNGETGETLTPPIPPCLIQSQLDFRADSPLKAPLPAAHCSVPNQGSTWSGFSWKRVMNPWTWTWKSSVCSGPSGPGSAPAVSKFISPAVSGISIAAREAGLARGRRKGRGIGCSASPLGCCVILPDRGLKGKLERHGRIGGRLSPGGSAPNIRESSSRDCSSDDASAPRRA